MKYKNIRELEIKVDSRLPFVALPCFMRQFFSAAGLLFRIISNFTFPLIFLIVSPFFKI